MAETVLLYKWRRDYDRYVDEYVLEDFPTVDMQGWGLHYNQAYRDKGHYSNVAIYAPTAEFPEEHIPVGNQLRKKGYSAVPLGHAVNYFEDGNSSLWMLDGWILQKPGGNEFEVREPVLKDSKGVWHVKIN